MVEAVIKIIQKLKQNGFKAYLVGGAVRDLIIGQMPKDFDLATNAKPEEVTKIFPKTKQVAREFGVVLVVENKAVIEVATFRADATYSDRRRPDYVIWSEAKEDARRRDFTINALFLDISQSSIWHEPTDLLKPIEIFEIEQINDHLEAKTNLGTIIDYVGGLNDLEKKYLRFVGQPEKRINEDHLRLIRAIRFKTTLALRYFENTEEILKSNIQKIKKVSVERIREELDLMLGTTKRAEAIKELNDIGALKLIIPELEPMKKIEQSKKFFQAGNIFDHTLLVLSHLAKDVDIDVVWAGLLHDIGKPKTLTMGYDRKKRWTEKFPNHNVIGAQISQEILKRLKFPRDRIEKICWLVENHQMPPQILEMRSGRQKRWLLDPRLPDLLILHQADALGKEKTVYLGWHDRVKKLMEEELAKPPPPPRLITGFDVMTHFKLEPGPEIGRLLAIAEEAQWEGEIKTKKEALELLKKNLISKS